MQPASVPDAVHAAPAPPGAEPPAPFDGWKIIVVGIAAQMLGVGLIQTYQFLVTPLIDEFGTSKARIGLGMSVFALTGALLSPFLGLMLDRSGSRVGRYMLGGVVAMLVGMFALASAGSLLQLLAASVLVFAGILLYGPLPAHVLIVNWFALRRGRALALAALGLSLPGFVFPGLSVWLIDSYGWRSAFRVLGVGCAVLLVPLLWTWVISRPEDVGQSPDGAAPRADAGEGAAPVGKLRSRDVMRDRNFWIIAVGIGLMLAAPVLNAVYLVRHMEESGISRVAGATVVTWIAGFAIAGKLLAAALADRMDKRRLVWALAALQLVSWLLILETPGYVTMLIAGVGFGIGLGAFTPLPAVFVGAWFGRAAFGQVAGLMSPIRLPITLSMVPFGGWVADVTGGHAATFVVAMAAVAVGALLLIFLRSPKQGVPAGG